MSGDWTENRTQVGGYSNHLLSKFLPSPQAAKEGRAPAPHSGSGAHKHLLGSCRGEARRSRPSLLVPLGSGPRCWGRDQLPTSLRQPRLGSLRSLPCWDPQELLVRMTASKTLRVGEGTGISVHCPLSQRDACPTHIGVSSAYRKRNRASPLKCVAPVQSRARPRSRLVATGENGLRAGAGSPSVGVPRLGAEPAMPREPRGAASPRMPSMRGSPSQSSGSCEGPRRVRPPQT